MAHPPARSPTVLAGSLPQETATDASSDTPQGTALTTPAAHNGWTPERQSTFLRALASSHSVAEAAKAAGMGRQSAYKLRARRKGEPFDLAWAAALQCRFDALVDHALERAMHGVEVPHFYKGELVHTSRRFDERLTVAMLAMRDRIAPPPKLPRRFRQAAAGGGPDAFPTLLALIEAGEDSWEAVEARERAEYFAAREAEEMGEKKG